MTDDTDFETMLRADADQQHATMLSILNVEVVTAILRLEDVDPSDLWLELAMEYHKKIDHALSTGVLARAVVDRAVELRKNGVGFKESP